VCSFLELLVHYFSSSRIFSHLSHTFQSAVEVPTQITVDLLQNFIVKVKHLTSLSHVWDSQGTSSHAQVSIWSSTAVRSMMTKSRVSTM
jgi:hypothetical protein